MHRFRAKSRLYTVMDDNRKVRPRGRVLDARPGWVFRYDWQGQDLNDFPNVSAGSKPLERGPQ
jgi:hypothetical protein